MQRGSGSGKELAPLRTCGIRVSICPLDACTLYALQHCAAMHGASWWLVRDRRARSPIELRPARSVGALTLEKYSATTDTTMRSVVLATVAALLLLATAALSDTHSRSTDSTQTAATRRAHAPKLPTARLIIPHPCHRAVSTSLMFSICLRLVALCCPLVVIRRISTAPPLPSRLSRPTPSMTSSASRLELLLSSMRLGVDTARRSGAAMERCSVVPRVDCRSQLS